MRKHYIDNLRAICILLLFPYHTFMIYNNWGEAFYVHGKSVDCFSYFNFIVYPWWMTLLFTLAGISTAYALKKRTWRQYKDERINKLLTPVGTGILLTIPVQSYLADCFHNNYQGSYFSHYKVFFTKFTDLSGYDGGFTPAHLWFLFYLFIVSMIMLPIMVWYEKREKKIDGSKITIVKLLPYFLVILVCTPILEPGGKSIGEALACFAIGYFVLSLESVQERLRKNALWLGLLFLAVTIVRIILKEVNGGQGLLFDIEQRMVTWFGILAMLGIGKRFLDREYKVMKYVSNCSFALYFFHQSFLVIVGYYTLKYITWIPLQVVVIMLGTFVLSIFAYELSKRSRLTSNLFGIKYQGKK